MSTRQPRPLMVVVLLVAGRLKCQVLTSSPRTRSLPASRLARAHPCRGITPLPDQRPRSRHLCYSARGAHRGPLSDLCAVGVARRACRAGNSAPR
jgi:hypothetical protein